MIAGLALRRGPIVVAISTVTQLAGLALLFERREAIVAAAVGGFVGLLVGVLLLFVRKEPGVAAVVGGSLAILTGGALLLMAFPPHPVVLLILAPSIVGGIVALLNASSRWALAGAILLVLTSAYLLLIGGAGLVYVPVVVALTNGVWAPRPALAR
jgi:hypothetical protein